jgi:hypothetical protein
MQPPNLSAFTAGIAIDRCSAIPPEWEQRVMGIGDTSTEEKTSRIRISPGRPDLGFAEKTVRDRRPNLRESGIKTTPG